MVTVRQAVAEDDAGVADVEASAIATLRLTYRPTRKALEHKAGLASRPSRLVAVLGERIVGTLQYYVDGEALRVMGLGVHGDFRRRGIARSLVGTLRTVANDAGASCLLLHTVRETGNVPVFESLGFHIESECEDEHSESDQIAHLADIQMKMDLR